MVSIYVEDYKYIKAHVYFNTCADCASLNFNIEIPDPSEIITHCTTCTILTNNKNSKYDGIKWKQNKWIKQQ